MDIYDVSFFLSTMWVGPFWFAMLVYPEHDITERAMRGPWFFLGPILIWFVVTASDPEGLVELASDSMDPSNAMSGLATLLGTRAGAAAAWAHMVAGDIFVTRWMWKRCIDRGAERWITAATVFFGVMLMPVGVALHVALVRDGAD
ncbi:MAG: DUF4281 domain-containing protein [Candidatus Thalassarchaeum sp.]|nr:DUF4281 domain-containing protein [Candidatus Thalassarchaeum sp.]|tara:strand:+ start:161 stop:598 length:438 start_codon:yes stop_codon:yes gene_type:complete